MYAIIVTGGKQYRVEQGDIVYIEKLDVEADSEVKFDQVLAIGEEGSVKAGLFIWYIQRGEPCLSRKDFFPGSLFPSMKSR